MMRAVVLVATLLAFVFVLCVGQSHGRTIVIPDEHPLLQFGVDAAAAGDTVLVMPGTYYENVFIDEEHSSMVITSLDVENTVIDGMHRAACLSIERTNRRIIVENLTFMHGWGGIHIVEPRREVVVRRNRFVANSGGQAGGIDVYRSRAWVTIADNLFWQNHSAGAGGASSWSIDGGATIIRGNTFVGNTGSVGAASFAGYGEFRNNIVALNTGTVLGGVYCGGEITLSCNDFWLNVGGDYSGCTPGTTDITADPEFCSVGAGDFRLFETSPCAPANAPAGCGLIGAYDVGCGVVPVLNPRLRQVSWGTIKTLYVR